MPRLPEVIPLLLKSLRDPDASASDYVAIIKRDPLLAAAVLKVANSAYFKPSGSAHANYERAVVALQAFLFHRARRNWGVDGKGSGHDVSPVETYTAAEPTAPEQVASGVRCPHCGEHNGDDFTFCQRCVQRLQ